MKLIHGPKIKVQNNSREAANQYGLLRNRLRSPYLCQEDDEGNVLIADWAHDRLFLFTADCKWHDVTPNGGLKRPIGALSLNRRLYVISLLNKSITMFE